MSAGNARILFLVSLWVFKVYGRTSTPAPCPPDQCDLRPLTAAFHRLEQHLGDRVNTLSNDIRTNSRQVDYQNKGIQKAVTDCRNDIERFVGRTRRESLQQPVQGDPSLDEKLEDLSRKLQVTLATLHLVNVDLSAVRKNLSDVLNITSTLWEKIETESSIQKLFRSAPDQPSPILPTETTNPKNCRDIQQKSPNSPSGIYLVQPDDSKPPFMVFCDMVVQDGGWLTIHSRYEGSQDFYLGWQDYKMGFGNIAGEFWLGLDKIYQLTGNTINELLIEIEDPDKIKSVAHYSYFSIGSEEEGYSLKVLGGYKGNAGDALSYQAGSKFSTKDKDQDSWSEGNCAQSHSGAWWYKACDKSNLNGRYIPGPQPDQFLYQAMYWGAQVGPQVGLVEARMLIRPRAAVNAGLLRDSV